MGVWLLPGGFFIPAFLRVSFKVLPSSSLITIKNLNTKKRPVSVVADNIEVRNIKSVNIKINNSINFKLLYDGNNSLSKKIKLEQIRKQVWLVFKR